MINTEYRKSDIPSVACRLYQQKESGKREREREIKENVNEGRGGHKHGRRLESGGLKDVSIYRKGGERIGK